MRISELRNRLADYFADPDTYAQDIIHSELGGISVNDAIAIGMEQMRSGRRLSAITLRCQPNTDNGVS